MDFRIRGKQPEASSRGRFELRMRTDVQKSTGRTVHRSQRIDRRDDWYDEVITDAQTGRVVHECHERLSEHLGRSSAKRPDPPS